VRRSPLAAVPVDEATDLDDLPPGRLDNLAYEADPVAWGPINCGGQPTARPRRFIDGTVFARTAATFVVDGALRPAVLAAVGAAAMELDAETIRRVPETLRFQTVLCLLSNGIPGDHLTKLEIGLDAVGIELLAPTDDHWRSSAATGWGRQAADHDRPTGVSCLACRIMTGWV
jgi:hypothetical protein